MTWGIGHITYRGGWARKGLSNIVSLVSVILCLSEARGTSDRSRLVDCAHRAALQSINNGLKLMMKHLVFSFVVAQTCWQAQASCHNCDVPAIGTEKIALLISAAFLHPTKRVRVIVPGVCYFLACSVQVTRQARARVCVHEMPHRQ